MTETRSTKNRIRPESTEKEMSFFEHLDELRWHLVRSVAAILVFAVLAFLARSFVFDTIILGPNSKDFVTNRFFCWFGQALHLGDLCMQGIDLKIINLSLSGQFTMHLYISFALGLVAATPYLVWEIWRFLRPALNETERKYARGAVLVISLLFAGGVSFGYFVIAPLTINFFGGYQVSDLITNQISLTSYITTIVTLALSAGVVFELPVFVFFLARVGIVTPEYLRKTRKYTLVIILILAAILTPPDIFSQILVGIPLYGLFELSIWVAAKAGKRNAPAG